MVAEDPLRVATGFSPPCIEAVKSRPCTQHQGKWAKPKGTFPDYKDLFFRKRLLSRGQIPFPEAECWSRSSRERGTDGWDGFTGHPRIQQFLHQVLFSTSFSVDGCWLCFLVFFFLMWTIFKVFTRLVTVLLLFYISVFWLVGMWGLSSPTRDRISTPALEGKVLTTRPPAKSPTSLSGGCFHNVPSSRGLVRYQGPIPSWWWQPLQYSCLENSMDRGAWQATVHRITESDTT